MYALFNGRSVPIPVQISRKTGRTDDWAES